MRIANEIRSPVLVTLWLLIAGITAVASELTQLGSDFVQSHITNANSDLPSMVVDRMEQSPDGYLWLITNGRNISRFDGKSFYSFRGQVRPTTLAFAPDGDLWLGTADSLLRVPSSSLGKFAFEGMVKYLPGPGKASEIICLRFGRDGTLWVGTADGLFRFRGGQFTAFGPRKRTNQIEETPEGHILLTSEQGFTEFAGDEEITHAPVAERLGVKETEIFDVTRDRQGNIWYCTAMGVAREKDGRIEKLGTYAKGDHAAFRAYEDPRGTVWIGKYDGLFRATPTGLDLVIADVQVRWLYSDRENNLWVGSNGNGLYRLKDRMIRTLTTADGLGGNTIMSVVVAHDGAVWAGANCGGVSRIDGTKIRTYNEKDGLANGCVWALAQDANHDIWIGTWGGGAFHYQNGTFKQYSKAQGLDDRITSIVVARNGAVWFGSRGGGIARLLDGNIRSYSTDDGLPTNDVLRLFEDRSGVIWAGTRQGLCKLVNDRFENVSAEMKGALYPVGEDGDGGFFVTEESEGIAINHRIESSRSDTIREFESYDMIKGESGELWFSGVRISRTLFGAFEIPRQSDEPLDYEDFSTEDGLLTNISGPGRSLAIGSDGKLWVATVKGLVSFDLRRMPISNAKPLIYLKNVTIGRNTDNAKSEILLPPGTNHVQIDFATVELSSPEKIRMQYRLDDVDQEWLDAGASPHAIYSSIPVGTHSLHIRACNRNGIWDRQGVTFTVTQLPYFYQTRWFTAAMAVLGLLLFGLIYRLRVAQISHRLNARFNDRLAERTRVAREIHDTFLQTVQGSKMVADHALRDPADHARMARAMQQLSTWLEQATDEGRAALNSLRASTTERNDLAEAFRRAIESCDVDGSTTPTFSVVGESKDMHPIVRDEVYRIGYEAIRNACVHSAASQIEVELRYDRDLIVRIKDNGKGIDPAIVSDGKEGHFGLQGMQERTERIGAKMSLDTSLGSGTEITLIVPGDIAFGTSMSHE